MTNTPHTPSELEEEFRQWAARSGVPLDYLPETDSTNLAAREKEYPNGTVVLAERQTAGRGQRGNRWSSAPGENLTFSVVLHPDFLPAQRQFYLSKAVSLALADTLEGFLGGTAAPQENGPEASGDAAPNKGKASAGVFIKWPNDIYVNDRKIVGILIENDLSGETLARSIVGIGLNVNQTRFPAELPNPTSLALETGTVYGLTEVLDAFYLRLSRRYDQLGRGDVAGIDRDYLGRIFRLGSESRFADGRSGEAFRGTITGVRPSGELEVRHSADGRTKRYLFKEIEYLL